MTEVLEAELVAEQPKSNYLVGILLSTLLISSVFLLLSYSGSDEDDNEASFSNQESGDWRSFSVVAPVDTGINVYHDHFRTNETYPQWLLDDLGVNKVCSLTFEGTWEERYEADRASCWDTLNATR